MEAFDMTGSDHPYFVGVQYHPEYLTRPLSPSPPYLGLLLACLGQWCNKRLFEKDRTIKQRSVVFLQVIGIIRPPGRF